MPRPLLVVVLVDESGSLSRADVGKEKEAARVITSSVPGVGSVVSVAGFGSSNAPTQSAVRVVCPPTVLPATSTVLGNCVDALHRRAPEEGDDTDHAAALGEALRTVRSSSLREAVVFLLTDGKLDVSRSALYGDTPERRNSAAALEVRETLKDLARSGAQVWPLGFGAVDEEALRKLAAGRACRPTDQTPRAMPAATTPELTRAIAAAFAARTCVQTGPGIDPSPPSPTPTSSQPVPHDNTRQTALDRQRKLLRDGTVAIGLPAQMTVDVDVQVEVTVAGATPPSDFPRAGPTVVVETAQVGSDLTADLSGNDFAITRVGGDDGRRTLATDSSARWIWQVRPLSSGPHTLYITLAVRVTDENGTPTDLRTFVRQIDVAVNPSYAIGQWLQTWWAATGLSIPVIVGGIVALVRLRRHARSPNPDRRPSVGGQRNAGPRSMTRRRPSRRLP